MNIGIVSYKHLKDLKEKKQGHKGVSHTCIIFQTHLGFLVTH